MLIRKEDIELNTWYTVADISLLIGKTKANARALLSQHKDVINNGVLLPYVAKVGRQWQITGKGVMLLLDILKYGKLSNDKECKKMARKSFKTGNTALDILEAEQDREIVTPVAEPAEAEQEQQQQQLAFVYRKEQAELKTKRVQFVFKPSLYEKLKAAAKANNTSANDYVHQLLENVLQDK